MDIRELLRQLRATPSDRAVRRAMGLDRRTVRRYRHWAIQHNLLTDAPLPALEDLQQLVATTLTAPAPPQTISAVAPYREQVLQLRAQGVEIAAIHQRLTERGFTGSYAAVYRFVRTLEPQQPDAAARVERLAGEEAQADFGSAGHLIDPMTGTPRTAYAFVMTLAYSRHQYVEFVFDQTVATWLTLHQHAFAFFQGVPRRVVIDNLKAAITKACATDPQVQAAYRECAEHYGFMIGPCRPRTPEHKGKVEQGGVHYVKRNFLGGRERTTLTTANADVRQWCLTTAGMRTHGTTKQHPLAQFQTIEQACLLPLPTSPYDLAVWKVARLHRDCHVVFENAFYSAPFRLVGQEVLVRGGSRDVRIYTRAYDLVATHDRATQPGQRQTHPAHYPPDKLPGLTRTREACQAAADDIGPATAQVVQTMCADPVLDRLPIVGRLLRLRERVGDDRLEAACARALRFDDPSYPTIKRMLDQHLEDQLPPPPPPPAPARTFARSAGDLLGHLFGGVQWT